MSEATASQMDYIAGLMWKHNCLTFDELEVMMEEVGIDVDMDNLTEDEASKVIQFLKGEI